MNGRGINTLRRLLPTGLEHADSPVLNRLRCLSHNLLEKNEFKMHYRRGLFEIDYHGMRMRFKQNPFLDLVFSLRGYLANYSPGAGEVVVDCGAYVGVFTILSSRLVGKNGRVLAFEPDGENFRRLLENIELNDASNVTAIPKGVWSSDTRAGFSAEGSQGAAVLPAGEQAEVTVEIPVVSLDNELERLGISRVGFIKMDVEGAELEAIRGCGRILAECDVQLAIASYHVVDGKETRIELEEMLSSAGMKVDTSYPEHLTTFASRT